MGKTSFIRWLERYFRIFYMPHSKWMEGFDNNKFDICVCDEFNGGCYPLHWINEA